MIKIKYDASLMQTMSLFEKITGAKLKDCFETQDSIIFIVQPGQIGKAIGKNAINIKKIEKAIPKKFRIVEFNPNKLDFIKNLIYPRKFESISEEEGIITVKGDNTQDNGLIIGKNARNLREMENIARRYFADIKEIKVVL